MLKEKKKATFRNKDTNYTKHARIKKNNPMRTSRGTDQRTSFRQV